MPDTTPDLPEVFMGTEAERPGSSPDRSLRKDRLRMPDFDGLPDDPREIDVDFDEEAADVTYANSVMVRRSPEEFVFDFIRIIPGVPGARLESRIIVTPQNATRLFEALEEHIELDRSPGERTASVDAAGTDADLGPENGHASLDETPSDSLPTVEPELLTATFSLSGEAVHCNEPWTSILGTTDHPWAHLSDEDQSLAESAVLEARKGSLVTNRLVSAHTHHREEPLPILLHFIPVHDDSDGETENFRAVTASGEVLAEPPSWMLSQTQRHRMQTLGRMTMGVAHDLNNLLSGLVGHIELLKEEVEHAPLSDSIHTSIDSIEV